MYFHRIITAAGTPYVFFVHFNFIITTAVTVVIMSHYPKWGHPVPVCRSLLSNRSPPPLFFPTTNTTLKSLVSVNPGFRKIFWNLVSQCDCPFRSYFMKVASNSVTCLLLSRSRYYKEKNISMYLTYLNVILSSPQVNKNPVHFSDIKATPLMRFILRKEKSNVSFCVKGAVYDWLK